MVMERTQWIRVDVNRLGTWLQSRGLNCWRSSKWSFAVVRVADQKDGILDRNEAPGRTAALA